MTQRHVEQLSRGACAELLRESSVGRIVFVDKDGPAALPVNYGLAGDDIIFRIEQQSNLRGLLKGPVAFEVDHMVPEADSGWSVLVRGTPQEVPIDEVPGFVKQMKETLPRPWAEGVHNVWVAIKPREVTGRKLTGTFIAAL